MFSTMTNAPKFAKTYCSQCGGEFGPGDAGYSHCSDHKLAAVLDEIEEYLADRQDADQPAGCDRPIPNEEMRLLIELRAARGMKS